jgi:cytochrome oxidase Cu insertion factor (SCO1/SenC/PrrC family)
VATLLAGLWAGLGPVVPAVAHQGGSAEPPVPAKRAVLPVIKPAPDFLLVSHTAEPIRLADLRGKVVVLDFFYASCPDLCPLATARLARLQRRLHRAGLLGRRVVLLSATLDPARDTEAVLRAQAEATGAKPGGWLFLRGGPSELDRLLAAYDVWTRRAPDGSIDHSMRIYLIDREGRIREIYSYSFFTVEQALLDIASLLEP